MPKLLDYIKEKGLTHEQVIEMLEKSNKPDSESNESTEPDEESEQDDLPDSDQIELEAEIEEEEDETEQISMDELDKKIDDRIKKVLKIKRKVPSKGKIIKKSEQHIEPAVIKKNWYEELC